MTFPFDNRYSIIVGVSIVLFKLKDNIIGVSARSTGEVNVQVIMEKFGGGGHQNVAGSQIKNRPIGDLENDLIKTTLAYMKEVDHNESNIVARS